jgi:hypothetical protein
MALASPTKFYKQTVAVLGIFELLHGGSRSQHAGGPGVDAIRLKIGMEQLKQQPLNQQVEQHMDQNNNVDQNNNFDQDMDEFDNRDENQDFNPYMDQQPQEQKMNEHKGMTAIPSSTEQWGHTQQRHQQKPNYELKLVDKDFNLESRDNNLQSSTMEVSPLKTSPAKNKKRLEIVTNTSEVDINWTIESIIDGDNDDGSKSMAEGDGSKSRSMIDGAKSVVDDSNTTFDLPGMGDTIGIIELLEVINTILDLSRLVIVQKFHQYQLIS